MNELEATRAKLKCLEMVEGTGLDWWRTIRDKGCKNSYCAEPTFCCELDYYELALGVVEGKPVWEGDRLYLDGVSHVVRSHNSMSFHYHGWSWSPPKPIIETFESWWERGEFGAPVYTHSMYFARMGWEACRKTMEINK